MNAQAPGVVKVVSGSTGQSHCKQRDGEVNSRYTSKIRYRGSGKDCRSGNNCNTSDLSWFHRCPVTLLRGTCPVCSVQVSAR